jgi:hypothetical protein
MGADIVLGAHSSWPLPYVSYPKRSMPKRNLHTSLFELPNASYIVPTNTSD